MRCLLFAYSEVGAVAFETLLELGEDIVGLVTHEDNPGEERWWRSVREMAQARGIPVRTVTDPNTPETLAWARRLAPDILFSFYYRLMLKKPWLECAPLGAFNLHGSLLPKFRGRAPINWAIVEGATETGLTLHEMVERPDAGRIVDQASAPIFEHDTARDVFERVVPLTRVILARTVPLLRAGQAPRREQNDQEASYFGARKPSDGEIHWEWPARRIHNLVRAVTRPYPGAFTFVDGRKLFIWKGRVWTDSRAVPADAQPGQIAANVVGGVAIRAGDGYYLAEHWQFEDRPEEQPALSLGTIAGHPLAKERL